jgi:hypothetical protein
MSKRPETFIDGGALEEMESSPAKKLDLSGKLWFPWLRDGRTRTKVLASIAGGAVLGGGVWVGIFHSEPTHLARATGGDVVEAGAKTGAGIGTGGCFYLHWLEEIAHGHPLGVLAAANACADHTFSSGAATIPIVGSAPKGSEACVKNGGEFVCPGGYTITIADSQDVQVIPPVNSEGAVPAHTGQFVNVDGRRLAVYTQSPGLSSETSPVTAVSIDFAPTDR